MDKLKPIITHRFWILFVIALIMPTIGWWSATSTLIEDTEKKTKAVDQAFTESVVATAPNPSWTPTAEKLAKLQKARNAKAWRKLWDEQEQLMNWPDLMKQHVPRKPSGRIDFFGEFRVEARTTYRNQYQDDVERVWLSAKPYIPETNTGQVLLDRNVIPSRIWSSVPKSKEMWEAQQDQWLLEGLLKAVTKINGNATSVSNSIVRKVSNLTLLGGNGEKSSGEAAEGGGEYPGGEGGFPGGDFGGNTGGDEDTGNPGDYPGGRGAGMSEVNIASPGVSFPPTDEFGTGGTVDLSAQREMPSESREGGDGEEAPSALRYVGSQEGGMFLRRGFYMEIVIDHRKLPEFLVTLENSSWPTTISRVQMVKLPVQKSGLKAPPKPKISFAPRSFTPSGSREQPESSFDQPDFSDPSGRGGASNANANALNNEYLWEVAISGLMVLYNPPPEVEGENQPQEKTSEPETKVDETVKDPNAAKDETTTKENENTDASNPPGMTKTEDSSSAKESENENKEKPLPNEKDAAKTPAVPEKEDEKSADKSTENNPTKTEEKKE